VHDERCFGLIEFRGDPFHLIKRQRVRVLYHGQRISCVRLLRENIYQTCDQGHE
jgi:hypothetical protein